MAKFAQVHGIVVPDPTTDRAIDQVRDALNGVLRQISDAPIAVTGSRGGNAALASLLSAMARLGFVTDNTTV